MPDKPSALMREWLSISQAVAAFEKAVRDQAQAQARYIGTHEHQTRVDETRSKMSEAVRQTILKAKHGRL